MIKLEYNPSMEQATFAINAIMPTDEAVGWVNKHEPFRMQRQDYAIIIGAAAARWLSAIATVDGKFFGAITAYPVVGGMSDIGFIGNKSMAGNGYAVDMLKQFFKEYKKLKISQYLHGRCSRKNVASAITMEKAGMNVLSYTNDDVVYVKNL